MSIKRYQSKIAVSVLCAAISLQASAKEIIHDAEYYILKSQNGEKWAEADKGLTEKLSALKAKHGTTPNIVYILWDDQQVGAVGNAMIQQQLGYSTPKINQMAEEGINFTRMYSEPSCTPTRAAFMTGRTPVRNGMGIVGMPHESRGLAATEVTIAEVLSSAGYATAFYGKGHLGDIEESYLHNQGFDEALFTPMNQISSLWNPGGTAVNAVLGMHPDMLPEDPYAMDSPGLNPVGWVMTVEGKKGEKGKEFCGTSNECYNKIEVESEKRTLEFIRTNAKAKKPFFVTYQPVWLNFLEAEANKSSLNGGKIPNSYARLDAFVGSVMDELKTLGIAENTLFVAMADNGPMSHNPPPGWAMTEIMYRGGKGDYTEGGVRVPALAWWPGTIAKNQLVGDIIHVTDLFTTFASIAGAKKYIPTDRVIDGIDQTELLLEGDTHSRRDYVHIYQGHTLAATVKGRYKRHWIGLPPGAASGIAPAYYDLYQDPHEHNPQMIPMIHFQGQFTAMRERHEAFKKKYPDVENAHGIPYTGLSNARPETLDIAKRLEREKAAMPKSVRKYIN
ncbi:MAG: sulfatase-like hydrolase/transferase [Pseudomonadales bacterium]|nr:sulfatase-like hydrolase/transferase [Pseudomonadales bacterium]